MARVEAGASFAQDDNLAEKAHHQDDEKSPHDLCSGPPSPLPKIPNVTIVHQPDDYNDEYPEGGRGWIVVFGCFLQATITLGMPLAYGVFQEYYTAHNVFPGINGSILSLLGAANGAVMPITSFVFGKLADRYGYRRFIILGSLCSFCYLFGSAWSTKLWHYFLTQGFLLGFSNGVLFPVLCAYPSQWFKRRRGLATGIVIAGSSVGGGCTALLLRTMLSKMSLRRTFLVYSGIDVVVLSIAFILVKERPKVPRPQAGLAPKINWVDSKLFRDPVYWSLMMSLVVSVFGYQVPYFLLSVYTREKVPNISQLLSTLPITICNFSAAIGRILVGFTADHIGPTNTFIIAITVSGLTQIAIWDFAYSYGSIIAFSILYGFWGGCFVSLLSPVGAHLFGHEQLANLSGLLVLSNLPGFTAGPTLAGVVLTSSKHNWHVVTFYSGGVQLFGVLIFLYARFKRERRVFVVY